MENMLLNSKKKQYGLFEAALATILFIVFNVVFLFIYRMFPLSLRQNKFIYYFASFMIEFLFAVAAFVVATSRKVDFKEATGLNKKINGNIVFYGALISFASLILFGNLTNVFIEFLYLSGYSSILGSLDIPNFGVYLIYVLISCVTPAVCEEILFRGVIASGLKEKGFKFALILSSVIFTLMHGNPEQTVHQFVIGLVVGFMFLKTGNVWLGIIVHFFNNFISVTQVYMMSFDKSAEVATESVAYAGTWGSFFGSLIIALLMALIGYFVVRRLMDIICKESDRINNVAAPVQENATIKVDDAEVAVEMTVDGAVVEQEQNTEENVTKTKKEPVSALIIVMFALAGAYFAFEWLSSLFMGLGIF